MPRITCQAEADALTATRDRLMEVRLTLHPRCRVAIDTADEAIERLTEALADWEAELEALEAVGALV